MYLKRILAFLYFLTGKSDMSSWQSMILKALADFCIGNYQNNIAVWVKEFSAFQEN